MDVGEGALFFSQCFDALKQKTESVFQMSRVLFRFGEGRLHYHSEDGDREIPQRVEKFLGEGYGLGLPAERRPIYQSPAFEFRVLLAQDISFHRVDSAAYKARVFFTEANSHYHGPGTGVIGVRVPAFVDER